MKLNHPHLHLTYCTNIHPGENWEDVFAQLKANVPKLKYRLSPEDPFGIGLRLSAAAANELQQSQQLKSFMQWLDDQNTYVFTMNGFPYGSFHGEVVKDHVYKPDWSKKDRLDYTLVLTQLLAKLVPDGLDGGISTSPISYKPWIDGGAEREKILQMACRQLAEVTLQMANIEATQDTELHLDIEPEPDCLIENTEETISFFTDWLLPIGTRYIKANSGYSKSEAHELLLRHIRVCYDTCHFAVEYEDPQKTIRAFKNAGIQIGKVQISAALQALLTSPSQRRALREKLMPFKEDVYLHQVKERTQNDTLISYSDLPSALTHIEKGEAMEWRIHYHVPVFIKEFGMLNSTQDAIIQSLNIFKAEPELCNHFEIETYTWTVLPDALKRNIVDSIEREFKWVIEAFD